MNNLRSLILFMVLFTFFSCGKRKQLNGSEYMRWVENPENGLKKEKKIGNYSYRVFLKPPDYVVCREITNNNSNSVDYAQAQSRIESLKKMCLFNFDIVSADGKVSVLQHQVSEQDEYASRVNYFVSFAQQDFKLIYGEDTLPCILYHFEQTFGATAFNTISLGFEKKTIDEGKDIQLIYNDRLFNTGDIKFLFPKNKLKNIPQLVL